MSLFENFVSSFRGKFVILRPISAVWSRRVPQNVFCNHQDERCPRRAK